MKSRSSETTIRVRDGESIIIGGLLSNDKKLTTYSVPILSKIPWIGKKLFTSTGVVERKTDLIIQITPTIVVDAYTGITKSADMIDYENYVIHGKPDKKSDDESKPEMEEQDPIETENEDPDSGE